MIFRGMLEDEMTADMGQVLESKCSKSNGTLP